MTNEQWQETKRLFAAVEGLGEAEFQAYLHQHCRDELIATTVKKMRANQPQLESFLREPLVAQLVQGDEVTDATGRRVGAYLLQREIGRGGMGVVYLATRADEAFQREVAIKLLWPGFPGDEARFHRERQILAKLDHPGIARLLDGGVTPEGWQYIVMDYIQGVPITTYCKQKNLSLPERLKLFQEVCEVVHYAHQNLVIHRDIKPGNILVTEAGQVKLLDFGIAKLMAPEDPSPLLSSLPGNLMMTPEYASPEQLLEQNVTTVSDIYSLGVVLYELLTGVRPYDVPSRSPQDAVRRMKEASLVPPSKRILSLQNEAAPDTATEQTSEGERQKLSHRLRGDLDNITLMALRYEESERYHSAAQFSDDITKHLTGEIVIARQPTFSYRADRFLRRHKGQAVGAFLLLVALVAGLIGLLIRNQTSQAEARRSQRLLYAADMREAGRNWDEGNLKQMGRLLDPHKPGHPLDDEWRGFEWYYLWNLLHPEHLTLQHDNWVYYLAYSPDGKIIYTTTRTNEVEKWDAATGTHLGTFATVPLRSGAKADKTDAGFRVLTISRDGKKLWTVGEQEKIHVWDLTNEQVTFTYPSNVLIFDLTLSADEKTLVTGGFDHFLRFWDTQTGQFLKAIEVPGFVRPVEFSKDGKFLVGGGSNGVLRVWDAVTHREIANLDSDPTDDFFALAIDATAQRLYTGGKNGRLRIWDLPRRKLLYDQIAHAALIDGMALSRDGKMLVTSGDDSTVRLWNTETRELLTSVKAEGPVSNVTFSPDEKFIAGVCMRCMQIKIWEVAKLLSPTRVLSPALPPARDLIAVERIWPIALSADGKTLATGSGRGELRLWELPTGLSKVIVRDTQEEPHAMAFSPDGRWLATANRNRPIFIRAPQTGQILTTLTGHQLNPLSLAFSPDSKFLAVAGDGMEIRLWETQNWQQQVSLGKAIEGSRFNLNDYVTSLSFSPNGLQLAAGYWNNAVKIWDLTSRREIRELKGHTGAVWAVAFSPDGTLIATGSWDYTIRLWEAATGRELATLEGHGNKVNSLAFSPDGKRLASGSDDHTVRLWDPANGKELLVLKDHTDNVETVLFSPDGKMLISGSIDKTVRLRSIDR
jgi:WD40 repeat protein/serine/threonine protein kinase